VPEATSGASPAATPQAAAREAVAAPAPAHAAMQLGGEPKPQDPSEPRRELPQAPDAVPPPAPEPLPAPASRPAVEAAAAPQPAPPDARPLPAEIAAPPAPVTAPAALPAPEPPARPAPPVAYPARQVAPFAVALALGPDASISLTLDPGELGRVEVAIERSNGEAHISLRAERPETLALLQRDRAELERALTGAGIGASEGRAPSLSFGLGGEGGAAQGQSRRQPAPPRAAPAAPTRAEPARPGAPRGLIDLAI
jgi:Meckel syndrome type 1 protein